MGHQHGMDGVSKTDHPILGYFGHPKFGTSLNLTKPWISWTDIFRESGRKWNAKDMWLPSLFLERQCAFRSREFSPLRFQWPVEQTSMVLMFKCWTNMGMWTANSTWEDEFAALQITDDGRFSSLAWEMWPWHLPQSLELHDFIASTDDIGLCRIFCEYQWCQVLQGYSFVDLNYEVQWAIVAICGYLWLIGTIWYNSPHFTI